MIKDVSVPKEQQVKFLEKTIEKLESFKQAVEDGVLFIEDATAQDEHNAPTIEEAGSRNIYIRINYQRYEQDKR